VKVGNPHTLEIQVIVVRFRVGLDYTLKTTIRAIAISAHKRMLIIHIAQLVADLRQRLAVEFTLKDGERALFDVSPSQQAIISTLWVPKTFASLRICSKLRDLFYSP
jgi:hypothetical protein